MSTAPQDSLENLKESQKAVPLDDDSAGEVTRPREPSGLLCETFEEAGTHEKLLARIKEIGWEKPTPVQQMCLPYSLKGRDVAGFAQTGTGKTGVFLVSIAHRLLSLPERKNKTDRAGTPLALILAPTRELAMQIDADATALFEGLGVSSIAVFGGIDYDKQARQIREGVDIIVATPGRLKDYFQKKVVSLENCSQFICDEADRMFDMGFIEDVEFFLGKLSEDTQKLLFSATTNEQVKELAFEYLETPEYISVNPEVITPENIEQHTIICESEKKVQVMLGLFKNHQPERSIIFTNTKLVAEWLHYKLVKNGIEADLITGDLPQKKRIALIHKIKKGEIKALIATDVASRGLHIAGVTHVFNFDLPDDPTNYVHRIGRTARAGAKGSAYSLVCEDYGQNLDQINELLGENLHLTSEWYPNDYLDIEDASGNPYKDPDFQGATMDKTLRGRRDSGGRDRDRGGRDRDRGDDQRAGARGSSPAGEERGERGGRGRGGGRRGNQRDGQGQGQGRGRGGQGRGRGRSDQRPNNRKRHQEQPAAAAARSKTAAPAKPADSGSVTGMLKKMIKTIFGR